MKYIRTKDGHIYEIQTLGYCGVLIGHFKGADDNFNLHNSLREWQLDCKNQYFLNTPNGYTTCIKQADTIEELCDAYVIVPKDKKYKPYTINTLSVFDDFEDVLRHNDIYASIWVDALLKPVAKMNEKGELELCLD